MIPATKAMKSEPKGLNKIIEETIGIKKKIGATLSTPPAKCRIIKKNRSSESI